MNKIGKSQIFFWLLVAFIAGVAAASFLPIPIIAVWAFFVLGGTVAVFASLKLEERRKQAVAGFMLMMFAVGMFWLTRSSRIPASALGALVDQAAVIEGIIDGEPARGAGSQRLIVIEPKYQSKILVITRPYPEYRYGDQLKISGRLERPENFSRDFNYISYLAKDGIFYTFVFPEIEILAHERGVKLYQFLFGLKVAFSARLNRHFPEPHSSFLGGLILGERRSLTPELSSELQKTGTSHIVALSGYNITIVADALLKTLMFFFIPFAWAFWLATAGIVGFVMLTGAAASVVRAAIMGILVLIARREGRIYRMRNALILAAALMVFHNPQVLRFDVAFQLSFLATLGLIYGGPMVERWYESVKLKLIPPARRAHLVRERRQSPGRPGGGAFVREVLISTLSAQLFVLPLLVYQFGMLSLISPVANLAVIPLIPATMFLGFLAGGMAFIWDVLGYFAAAPTWALLEYELSAIHVLANLPLAALEVRGFGLGALIGGYTLIGYWLWQAHKRSRHSA